jgi:nondiscriminating glutamyl-tRNA synthetase
LEIYSDLENMIENGEFDYLYESPNYQPESLAWKDERDFKAIRQYICDIIDKLDALEESKFSAESVKNAVWDYATEKGRGSVLWPMRYSLTGKDKSPDPFSVSEILGKNESISRLKEAVKKLENIS